MTISSGQQAISRPIAPLVQVGWPTFLHPSFERAGLLFNEWASVVDHVRSSPSTLSVARLVSNIDLFGGVARCFDDLNSYRSENLNPAQSVLLVFVSDLDNLRRYL